MTMLIKKCRICNKELSIDNFYNNSIGNKDSRCKECVKNKSKLYAKNNIEKLKIYRKEYYLKNKNKLDDINMKWYWDNREKIRELQKKYYNENKEKIKIDTKLWSINNKNKANKYKRKYIDEHREKYNNYQRKRRARKVNVKELFLESWKQFILDLFKNKCFKCGSVDNLCLDHNFPLSRGFPLELGNIVLLCRSCNASKSNKFPNEYYNKMEIDELGKILEKERILRT